MNRKIKFKSLFQNKHKEHFKCAQCGKVADQYKNSIICKGCAVSNKLYEANMVLTPKVTEGKRIKAWYDSEIDDIRVKIEE